MSAINFAKYIEHTRLDASTTQTDVDRLVSEAIEHNFFGICVPPFWVKRAKREIGNRQLTLVTVIDFPLGYSKTETKLEEIKQAINDGADELDMVWNISALSTLQQPLNLKKLSSFRLRFLSQSKIVC